MKQQGFSLLELITVCAIIAIIAFSGSSSYTFLITRFQSYTDKHRLLSMVRMTRQLAINSSSTIVLCPTINTKICIRNWKLPTIVFYDTNKNEKRDNDEPIVQKFIPFDNQDIAIDYPRTQIRFNSQGMANHFNGTLSYCYHDVIEAIIISRLGRMRFAQDLDGDNIPDKSLGSPVTCKE